MVPDIVTFAVLAGFLVAGCSAFKLPAGLSMLLAALLAMVQSGLDIPAVFQEMLGGDFAYIETALTVAAAILFIRTADSAGTLDALTSLLLERFRRHRGILLVLFMFLIMLPGMLTGSAAAGSVIAGSVMIPVLTAAGFSSMTAGGLVLIGSLLGMAAPPVNLPAMILCAGLNIRWQDFWGILSLIVFPLGLVIAFIMGWRPMRNMRYEKARQALQDRFELREKYGIRIYFPVLLLVLLLLVLTALRLVFPGLDRGYGLAIVFLVSAIPGFFCGRPFKIRRSLLKTLKAVIPAAGAIFGVRLFIEVINRTGVRSLLIVGFFRMPLLLKAAVIAIGFYLYCRLPALESSALLSMPVCYLCSQVLGAGTLPVLTAVSLAAGLGDLIPPGAAAGRTVMQISGARPYSRMMEECVIPLVIMVAYTCCILFNYRVFFSR